jgi:uncharacterized protein with HEPN domain
MSRRDPETALRQILTHAREAVEIIGEAANRVPEDVQRKDPELPWLQMIGARNRLIHGYDNVDFDILWAITRQDLPGLIINSKKSWELADPRLLSMLGE